jgi:hypothetical protein
MKRFPSSLADLARRHPQQMHSHLRGAFEIERVTAAQMQMSERAWTEAFLAMRAPRDSVERQSLVLCRDVAQGFEAVVNSLRANRIAPSAPAQSPPSAMPTITRGETCRWCERAALGSAQPDLAVDVFGAVHARERHRVRRRPDA